MVLAHYTVEPVGDNGVADNSRRVTELRADYTIQVAVFQGRNCFIDRCVLNINFIPGADLSR